MIIDFIVKIFDFILGSIVNVLPVASVPAEVDLVFNSLASFLESVSVFFPVMTLTNIILLIISIELVILFFKGLVYVYRLIPGKFS